MKLSQLQAADVNTGGQIETTDNGVEVNTSESLRAGPRGYVLLEDTATRKKIIHFDHERQPERVVHALGHGAYGTFESYGDWSNMTNACWLQAGAVSEAFTRFSVVVSSVGGSANQRDTHGFATKIYSQCGNQDLVGNHVPSFYINDGSQFPDLIHSVKKEPNTGFPTDGSAHTTAYDFFNLHPEGAEQLMSVLSRLGIPRDVRHISGNSVHTYRFINAQGNSTLFKWYWMPMLGHRSLVYPEAQTLAGKNNDFMPMDLYNSIEAGLYPEWEFAVQIFQDDGTYMWNGYDLLQATEIIPFEVNPPIKLGKLTLNRNFENFFAEPESISFAPSNVVNGISFVPDPLLQWRLMSYDDTSINRHNGPNGYMLPINRPIAPINNNYRDGYMQYSIYEGASASTPDTIGGVISADQQETLKYSPASGQSAGMGNVGRYTSYYNWFQQACSFWKTLDTYGQQAVVDAYRFELGHVANTSVAQAYVDMTLNNIDNCLARRVAYGIGLSMPAMGSGANMSCPTYPSLYPLGPGMEPNKSLTGLNIAVVANDTVLSSSEYQTLMSMWSAQNVTVTVVGPRIGELQSGVNATASWITASSTFYDAIIIGSVMGSSDTTGGSMSSMMSSSMMTMPSSMMSMSMSMSNSMTMSSLQVMSTPVAESSGMYSSSAGWQSWNSCNVTGACSTMSSSTHNTKRQSMDTQSIAIDMYAMMFIDEAYSHGKAIGALGSSGQGVLMGLGFPVDSSMGIYYGDASDVSMDVMEALMGPVRFPQRFPVDDVETICGSGM